MSVRSLNTAVTCEKPLRDIDLVFSIPGIPASAVSTGNVTCFSISAGDRAGATVLIWTWLFVMSGTASTGSFVNDHAPKAAAIAVNSTTSQRY
jgi:hypothetical protein